MMKVKGSFCGGLKAEATMSRISAFPLIYLGKPLGAFLLCKMPREFWSSLKEEEFDANVCSV